MSYATPSPQKSGLQTSRLSSEAVQKILDFWFIEHGPSYWFTKDPKFDLAIQQNFGDKVVLAQNNGYEATVNNAAHSLAVILLCDQFSRNLYRDDRQAFAGDVWARKYAGMALGMGWDQEKIWTPHHRMFFYMPFMHSESLIHQELCLYLVKNYVGVKDAVDSAYAHYEIIKKFGRFPHRNAMLDRTPREEETRYLAQGGKVF